MEFKDNLRLYREKRGYSSVELATILQVPYTTYKGYENQGREPKYETLIKIADVLDISLDDLLGRTPKNEDEQLEKELNNLLARNEQDEIYELERLGTTITKSGFYSYAIALKEISDNTIVFTVDNDEHDNRFIFTVNKSELIKKMNEINNNAIRSKKFELSEFLFKLLRLNQQKEEYPMLKEWIDSTKPKEITPLYKPMLDILKQLENDLNKQENIDLINRFLNNK